MKLKRRHVELITKGIFLLTFLTAVKTFGVTWGEGLLVIGLVMISLALGSLIGHKSAWREGYLDGYQASFEETKKFMKRTIEDQKTLNQKAAELKARIEKLIRES